MYHTAIMSSAEQHAERGMISAVQQQCCCTCGAITHAILRLLRSPSIIPCVYSILSRFSRMLCVPVFQFSVWCVLSRIRRILCCICCIIHTWYDTAVPVCNIYGVLLLLSLVRRYSSTPVIESSSTAVPSDAWKKCSGVPGKSTSRTYDSLVHFFS